MASAGRKTRLFFGLVFDSRPNAQLVWLLNLGFWFLGLR
jgi:hypothetical protein